MLKKIKKEFFNLRFLKFLVIGGINTFVAQLLYIFFTLKKIEPEISSILGDLISVIISYILNLKITFKEKHNWKKFFTFPLSYIPGWVINFLLVTIVIYFGIPKVYAKLFSLPITVPLNFILMNIIMKIRRGVNNEN